MSDDRNLPVPFAAYDDLIARSRIARGADPKPTPPKFRQIYRNLNYSCDLHAGGTSCYENHTFDNPEGRSAMILRRLGVGLGFATFLAGVLTPLPLFYALAAILFVGAPYAAYTSYLKAQSKWKAHAADRASSDVMLTDGDHLVAYLKSWVKKETKKWLGEESALAIALRECKEKLSVAEADMKEQAAQLANAVGEEAAAMLNEAQLVNERLTKALLERKEKIIKDMGLYRNHFNAIEKWTNMFESKLGAAKLLNRQRSRLNDVEEHGNFVDDLLETSKIDLEAMLSGLHQAMEAINDHGNQTITAVDGSGCSASDFARLDPMISATEEGVTGKGYSQNPEDVDIDPLPES